MFRRNNPNDQSQDQGNILGGKSFPAPKPQSVSQNHPTASTNQNNFYSNFEQEMSEVTGVYGRVNPTSNSSTLRLAHAGISQEHFPGNPQLASEKYSDQNSRAQTKSVTTVTNQNFTSVPKTVVNQGFGQLPVNFVAGSQTLTPIRTESSYTVGQIQGRTPIMGVNLPQI